MKLTARSCLSLVFCQCLIGVSYIILEEVLLLLSPILFITLRFFFNTLLLGLYLLLKRYPVLQELKKISGFSWYIITIQAFFGVILFHLFVVSALSLLTAMAASFS